MPLQLRATSSSVEVRQGDEDPGDAGGSLLYTAVTWKDPLYEMPPKENDRLTADQVDVIRTWIARGAPWSDESAVARAWDEAPVNS